MPTHPRRPAARLAVAAALVALVGLGLGPLASPAPAQAATTADSMESSILSWVNADRAKLGLVPLRTTPQLMTFAGGRAATMASTGVMAHPSCWSCALDAAGIQRYSSGEAIAYTTWPWGSQAAQSIYNGWKNSPGHWAMLMSSTYNYIGIGVAYRSSEAKTFAAADMTESADQTKSWAKMLSATHSGTTVYFGWSGNDTILQTHTAGLRGFDVQYRVDSGSWSTIRSITTARSLSLTGRAHGHWYGVRVRSRDKVGNIGNYTAELRVWVP